MLRSLQKKIRRLDSHAALLQAVHDAHEHAYASSTFPTEIIVHGQGSSVASDDDDDAVPIPEDIAARSLAMGSKTASCGVVDRSDPRVAHVWDLFPKGEIADAMIVTIVCAREGETFSELHERAKRQVATNLPAPRDIPQNAFLFKYR